VPKARRLNYVNDARLTSLATLLRHRGECLEYLRSPKRQLAREVIRSPATPSDLLVEAGTTTEGERSFLAEIVRKSAGEAGPIIEIGTLFGFTTAEMALQKAPDRLLLTVDCFSWNPWGLTSSEHKRLAERVLLIGISRLNVKLIVSDKNAFYKSYAGATPSMVFLDAIHTYEDQEGHRVGYRLGVSVYRGARLLGPIFGRKKGG